MTKQTRNKKPGHKSVLFGQIGQKIDRLYEALSHSWFARILCGYDRLQKWGENSFFVSGVRKLFASLMKKIHKRPRREIGTEALGANEIGIFIPSSLRKSLKTRLSEAVEESVFLEKVVSFLKLLFFIPMISYGVFLFAFGLSTTVLQALLFFLQGQSSGAALDLFTGLALVLLSLPVMFKGYEPIIGCMQKSVLGSLILRSVFGVQDTANDRKSVSGSNFLLFFAGVLCGIATWLLPPMELIMVGVFLALAIGVVFVPEAGILLLLVSFPFLGYLSHPAITCALAVLYVGACWLIKVAIGKRSFSVDLSDALVLCLMLTVFISAFAGGQAPMQSALLYLAMMCGYLITANLLRSQLWIRRASSGLIVSSFVVAIIGLIQRLRGQTVSSVFGSQLILSCYLLLLIPLTLARLSACETARGRFRYLFVLAAQTACILVGGSRLALLIWLIELIGFGLLATRKTLSVLLIVALLLPIVYLLLPVLGVSIDVGVPALASRQEVSHELMSLIGKAPLTGIGMSDSLLLLALPDSSGVLNPELGNTYLRLAVQLGIPGLLLCLVLALVWLVAAFTLVCRNAGRREKCYTRGWIVGIGAMLVMGFFCYLWADYRLLMLFWCMAGLFQSVRKYSIEHENRKIDEAQPTEDLQWVNLDLYFDSAGNPKGSDFQSAQTESGGNKE